MHKKATQSLLKTLVNMYAPKGTYCKSIKTLNRFCGLLTELEYYIQEGDIDNRNQKVIHLVHILQEADIRKHITA